MVVTKTIRRSLPSKKGATTFLSGHCSTLGYPVSVDQDAPRTS